MSYDFYHAKKSKKEEIENKPFQSWFSELEPLDWFSKIKILSSFHLEETDEENEENFKNQAYKKFISGVKVCKSCGWEVIEDKKNKGYYHCKNRNCNKNSKLEMGADVEEIKVSEFVSDSYNKLQSVLQFDSNTENISFSFELKKPLLTNGEESFWIHENPIAKEKVFKVPMIRASSIKGKLRWVATRNFVENLPDNENEIESLENIFEERARIVRIFGNEKENMSKYLNKKISEFYEDKTPKEIGKEFKKYLKDQGYLKNKIESRRGRLQFYPVFFDEMGLEVITPIERKTGTADKPIQLEKVLEGAEGKMRLHYYPFDILGDEEEKNKDKEIIVDALYDMLTKYGIGAKTADGYGIAKKKGFLESKEELKKVIFND